MGGRGYGCDDGGAEERSGNHPGEVVVVVRRQIVAMNQHVVDGLSKQDQRVEEPAQVIPSTSVTGAQKMSPATGGRAGNVTRR